MDGCVQEWDLIPIELYRAQNILRETYNCGPKIEQWAKDIFSLAAVGNNLIHTRHLTGGPDGSLVLSPQTERFFLPAGLAYFRFVINENQTAEDVGFWNDPYLDDGKSVRKYLAHQDKFSSFLAWAEAQQIYTPAPVGYLVCLDKGNRTTLDPERRYVKIEQSEGNGSAMRGMTLSSREDATEIRLGFPKGMFPCGSPYDDPWMGTFYQSPDDKKKAIRDSLKEWTYKKVEETVAHNKQAARLEADWYKPTMPVAPGASSIPGRYPDDARYHKIEIPSWFIE